MTAPQKIPRPTVADGYNDRELAARDADLAALEADPRTAGNANRPPWLVARVLRDAGRR